MKVHGELMKVSDINIDYKKEYDFVFVSHLPSFYKINLFNEIEKKYRVLAIFLGETSVDRTLDFVNGEKYFDYCYLNAGDFEKRDKIFSSIRLYKILSCLNYKLISVGAWDLPESWVCILRSPKSKNVITQESSIFESNISGWKSLFKRYFTWRIGLALVSGSPHGRLMRAVGYKGKMMVTGGVGLPNRGARLTHTGNIFRGRFLYVGRLSPEKNIEILLRVFALDEMSCYQLTIVGDGPEREKLRLSASQNVIFLGHVPNVSINEVYLSNDIFILPSLSEPWGLVIEEALYYGLPVLVSSHVGSSEDLVKITGAGLVFDPLSEDSCKHAILKIVSQYDQYLDSALSIDFTLRDVAQVNVYVEAISERSTV